MRVNKSSFIRLFVSLLILSIFITGCGNANNSTPNKSGTEDDLSDASSVKFPTHDLTGVITFNPGGSMDNISRIITPFAEKHLGHTVVLQNKPGAAGGVATQFVHSAKADGHTLLYSAENANLYKVLDISQIDYNDFEPVILMAQAVFVVVVEGDSPYESYEDLMEDARKNPGKVRAGTNGPGSGGDVAKALLCSVEDVDMATVPFDSEGASVTAVLGGHIETTAVGLPSALEFIKSGQLRALALISKDEVEELSDIPLISSINPDFEKYLPWGPFYGVFVKKETPLEIIDFLKDAYKKAFDDPECQERIKSMGVLPLGTSGDEARKFINHVQSISAWMVYDTGSAEKSPEEFGIPRI